MFALLLIAAAPSDAVPAEVNPNDVVRCVRENVTGSLVTTRRVCHTVGEWKRIRADSSEESQRMFERGLIRPSGTGG